MSYIGKQPVVGNFQKCDAISVVNGQAAYSLTVGSAAVTPENANHMLVSLNGVLQAPGDSFTVSGSTLTFASNLATGDVIDFVIILGDVLDLGTPSDNSISTAKLVANSVTAAKFNADVISGQTALASAPADTDEFLVSDAGVLKRIDYSLIKGGGMFEKLLTTTISSSTANISFSSTYITTAHRDYRVVFTGLRSVNDDTRLEMYISDDDGSSYKSSNDHIYNMKFIRQDYNASTWGSQNSTNNDKFELTADTMGNDTGEAMHGYVDLFDPLNQNSDNQYFMWNSNFTLLGTTKLLFNVFGSGVFHTGQTTAFNNIKFQFNSGNILIGSATLYGRKI